MRRTAKITAARLPRRKTAVGAAAVHRAFPAWIDAEQGLAFSAHTAPSVSARVRAGLVLRVIGPAHSKRLRRSHDVLGGR